MQLFIAKDGKQTGPFTEDQVRSMLSAGFVAVEDLCWHEGLLGWLSVSQVLGCAKQASPPLSADSHLWSAPLSHSKQQPGFWLRFTAYFIDRIIVIVAALFAGSIVGAVMGTFGVKDQDVLFGLGAIAGIVVSWLYYALMESSPNQATLGKMVCGFIVTDLHGDRISFGKATGRYFCKFVSAMILFIGFLMCAWTERKQCLHDMMAGCLMFKTSMRLPRPLRR